MSITDLIARAWEQERAKYDYGGINRKGALWRIDGGDVVLWSDDLKAIDDHLDRLCAAAVEKALADAGYVVTPPRGDGVGELDEG